MAASKGSIGIGSLLYDGLGDTIRVSLTEDPWYEVPVATDLANRAMALWNKDESDDTDNIQDPQEQVDPFDYQRREICKLDFGKECAIGPLDPPRVISATQFPLSDPDSIVNAVKNANDTLSEVKLEGLMVFAQTPAELDTLNDLLPRIKNEIKGIVIQTGQVINSSEVSSIKAPEDLALVICPTLEAKKLDSIADWLSATQKTQCDTSS